MTTVTIPTLHTARLTLRAPQLSDLDALTAFRTGPRAVTIGGPFPADSSFVALAALAGHWVLRGFGRWMVADRATDQALGLVGPFHPTDWPEPEIAWTLFDHAEGRGIAHEAAQAALRYARDTLGWTAPMSAIAPDNTRSQALARRLGARVDGAFTHPVHGALDIWRHAGSTA